MISRNNIRLASAITLFGVMGIAGNLGARENVVTSHHKAALKSTASTTGCLPGATTGIDLDINNVRAHLMTGGDMWWDIDKGIASYEIPKGSGKHSQFAASCWIGGFDKQGQLKVAAQTYRQDGNDYWPGALDVNGKITRASVPHGIISGRSTNRPSTGSLSCRSLEAIQIQLNSRQFINGLPWVMQKPQARVVLY
jgi:hypothetical protein